MNQIDLTNIEHIKGILKTHGTAAKKALGQNFLVDRNALDKIIEAGELHESDQVLEIGPGLGVLTDAILHKTHNLTSLEMDREIIPILQINMHNLHSTEELKDWEVIHTDALKFDIDKTNFKKGYKLLANIPYFITSPLLRHFLKDQYLKNSKIIPSIIVFLIQKELAEKIVDKKKESVIGLNIKVFGTPEIIANVPAKSFHPAPKVDSAVLKITVHKTSKVDMSKIDINKFFETIERGFSSPRKKLRNNIPEELLITAGIDPNLRAEKLTIEDWVAITSLIK
ncbi:MAG: 16S rRNA (adenine(1518)-N(6)/adenine(1519)-N(6))-dimethyltransferase RsmA [Candidatus Peregrinibacteria bacterium]|nr:16S rRNA (adenine(1518)-N(6)/adenine(1519)-N(6))-dimethyltransferase RsmA [Candidatus Peregrinibacteria bacterium]MDZ4245398.1 16S rRNA (adenine(1518)-N(6)/adenine(1519)-N(6))-dimethyltransferase RsmA [Candidatus Gracilibacteria bacterium]